MNKFIDFVAKGLVDEPEAVEVSARERGGLTAYQLRVAEGDAGTSFMVFKATLSRPSETAVKVAYSTNDDATNGAHRANCG